MIFPTLDFEQELWSKGYSKICGIDEVGRGCFAGPVVVGAVIFSPDVNIPGIADSKLLNPKQREQLAVKIKDQALTWAVAEVGVSVINKVGIGEATQVAFRKVLHKLLVQVDFVLIDAFYIKHFNKEKQRAIIKGDVYCISIAAASIIAKVYRDNLMEKLHQTYPQYNFAKHKGYGTKEHQEAIKSYGLCKLHRKSFNLKKFINTEEMLS